MIRLLFVGAIALFASAAFAQTTDTSFGNPYRFTQKDGEALYRGICQGCHMPDGKGAIGAGAYPALAGNAKLETAAYPIFMVVRGNKGMPGFGRQLDDGQVAAVVNYIRGHFGNDYRDAVGSEEAKAARP